MDAWGLRPPEGLAPSLATLTVPIFASDKLLGGITLDSHDPARRFGEDDQRLLQTVAAAMGIALENARLFNETKEALERQTATSEVLRVISSSPSDLEPVYRTILESITRLCESQIAVLFLFDGERLSAAASHGTTTEFADLLRRGRPKPSHETTTRLAALERRTVHVADLLSDATFSPTPRDLYERENVRTVLSVPMLRDTTLIGVMTTWRREVRPFDERQIGLIQTFADQAVIAIENVRLFNETKEALEQQTVTSDAAGDQQFGGRHAAGVRQDPGRAASACSMAQSVGIIPGATATHDRTVAAYVGAARAVPDVYPVARWTDESGTRRWRSATRRVMHFRRCARERADAP